MSLRPGTPLHCLNLSATLSKLSFCFRKPLQSPTGGLSLLATRSPPVLSNDKTYNHINKINIAKVNSFSRIKSFQTNLHNLEQATASKSHPNISISPILTPKNLDRT